MFTAVSRAVARKTTRYRGVGGRNREFHQDWGIGSELTARRAFSAWHFGQMQPLRGNFRQHACRGKQETGSATAGGLS
jgi:hypothetical protein